MLSSRKQVDQTGSVFELIEKLRLCSHEEYLALVASFIGFVLSRSFKVQDG